MDLSKEPNQVVSSLTELCADFLAERRLIIMSNRGPVAHRINKKDETITSDRGSGGVISALGALSKYANVTWIASAMGEGDRRIARKNENRIEVQMPGGKLCIRYVIAPRPNYHKYYNRISNPLLAFLQGYMWNLAYTPNPDHRVYDAWENGYVPVNRLFAEAAIAEAANEKVPPIIMIHDYQLYLVGGYIRRQMPQAILQHFIHIPWPSSSYWRFFPRMMRLAILESLCSVDIVGLQTKRDVHDFIDTCEDFFGEPVEIHREAGTVILNGHRTKVASYPVSIDVAALQRDARSPRVRDYEEKLRAHLGEQTVVRVDRAEPSKNIIRGFKAYDTLLERYPGLLNRVRLLCFLVPSRTGIIQYQKYTQDIFNIVQKINTKYGNKKWQPAKIFFENNYAQAIAGMRLCDVLLVNPVIDGMNLVAKEGPIASANNSVLILSESAGAHEQLGEHVISIAPADVEGTTRALYKALTMDAAERKRRAEALRKTIEANDINLWLYQQFKDLAQCAELTEKK